MSNFTSHDQEAGGLPSRLARGIRNRFKRLTGTSRRGAAAIWGAVGISGTLAVGSLVVDGSILYSARADLQTAADASALAGASALAFDPLEVRDRATDYAAKNYAGGGMVEVRSEDIVLGDWDPDTRTFSPLAGDMEAEADAVRVTARLARERGNGLTLALAGIVGVDEADVRASATAVFRPRDIAVVLDLSGSMNYDSCLRSTRRLGTDAIIDNMAVMWDELGNPEYGTLTFETQRFNTENEDWVLRQLQLDDLPYPHPSGSWRDYVRYVMYDNEVRRAGFQYHYGGPTLLNYWMQRQRESWKTPGLHVTSQQPLTAVKNAVDVFLDLLREEDTDDQVALAVYTADTESRGLLESGLTDNYQLISSLTRARQAAHYDAFTNIAAGMSTGLAELEANARTGAHRTMILLTDGQANRPNDNATATAAAIDQAYEAAALNIPILTISLGLNAQTELMQEIADITGGIHFNIPGGRSVAEYEDGLREVFRLIAADRPLRLVD
ncbi:MAG: VWA domain-containing protein [Planctomycetota bacterium]